MTHTKQECCDKCWNMMGMAENPPKFLCSNPSCICHKQKSRAELIEEIVGEFKEHILKVYSRGHIPDYAMDTVAPIVGKARQLLLSISDASLDAMEVEEKYDGSPGELDEENMGWNSARAASQQKRTLFTK